MLNSAFSYQNEGIFGSEVMLFGLHKSSKHACVRVYTRMCIKYLPSPLFAWFSFVVNGEEAFLARRALLPPMSGLYNQHLLQYSSRWRSSVSEF